MLSFPVEMDTRWPAAKSLEDFYDVAASAETGGMYPVGANGLWHGGVHLSVGDEPPIYAPVAGHIVAARLDPDPERATCAFGDTNFILTRHTWPPFSTDGEGTAYFMLFMHLAPRPVGAVAQETDVAPWLTAEPLRRVTAPSGLNVRSQPNADASREGAIPRGRRIRPRGEPLDQNGYRWLEVDALRQNVEGYVAMGPLKDGVLDATWTEQVPSRGEPDVVPSLESGRVVQLDVCVDAGEMLWWGGEYGEKFDWSETFETVMDDAIAKTMELMGEDFEHPEPIQRAPSIHWEVFSAEPVFGAEKQGKSGSGSTSSERSENDSTWERSDQVEASRVPEWKTKEVTANERTFSPADSEALSLMNDIRDEADIPTTAPYRSCSLDEKRGVHFSDAGTALRKYAVKNVSEWAVQDVDRAVDQSPGREPSEKEDLRALQWWDEARDVGVDLPESRKVWHYHPVTAMKAISSQKPRFFVQVNGERHQVQWYEDVRDLVFEANGVPEDIEGIKELYYSDNSEAPPYDNVVRDELHQMPIQVEGPGGEPAQFARVQATYATDGDGQITAWYTGIYKFAEESGDLYDLLVAEEREGIPDLNETDSNIWASISESEGALKALNTYDRAMVTIGPVQQTIGVDEAKGELQGALETVRLRDPDAYNSHVGRYGLKVIDDSVGIHHGAQKAHARLHGEPLTSGSAKRRLQRFKWVYRLSEAFGDPSFRGPMLREAFRRLDRLREREVTLNVVVDGEEEPARIQTTIGNLFRRDLSQALLLDWHINNPASVWSNNRRVNGWLEAAENLFKRWGIASWADYDTLPSTTMIEKELQLVVMLLRARMGSMTNPGKRAGWILAYAPNYLINRVSRQEDYTMKQGYASTESLIKDFLCNELSQGAEIAWASQSQSKILDFSRC